MILAGRTRKGSTPSMAFPRGPHLDVGSAMFVRNTSIPHPLRLNRIVHGNLLLRSTTFPVFRPLRRFLPSIGANVGMNFENWQVSFGKQSLWWSPTQGGPLMFS